MEQGRALSAAGSRGQVAVCSLLKVNSSGTQIRQLHVLSRAKMRLD